METILLSEKDGYKTITHGNQVQATPLYSCCLVVMRMEDETVYAQHCAGTDLSTLASVFLAQDGNVAKEALMVSSRASDYQKSQAHSLQLKVPFVKLVYYEANVDNGDIPIVAVADDGSLSLLSAARYNIVVY